MKPSTTEIDNRRPTAQGTVFRKSLGDYDVQADGRTVACSLSSKLRKQLLYPTADPASIRPHVVEVKGITMVDPVAIGDVVGFVEGSPGTGMITEVLARRSKLSRRAPGSKPLEQIVVANLDQIVIVVAAAKPAPKWKLVDRHLVTAEGSGVAAIICVTKMDLAREEDLSTYVRLYERIGYRVLLTCAPQRQGTDELRGLLRGRSSVLIGKSGVGKTTLLNGLQPGLGLRVQEVSAKTDKGKHTTSHLEMFSLDFGGTIVDTPGMREFGLWNVQPAQLPMLFPEMRPHLGQCRFAGCTHTHEPDCAIKQAVSAGKISDHRYQSFRHMR